jgi:GNAT superfamily N-acetyltransferase
MTLPSAQLLYDVMDHTWPSADMQAVGPFIVRRGDGGGSRVSAALLNGTGPGTDFEAAAATMQKMDQPKLFMLKDGQDDFDAILDAAGYVVKDPVNVYAAPVAGLASIAAQHKPSFAVWPPLAAQREIWAKGGVGPARLAVMDRAQGAKTTIMARAHDRPSGTVYVAMHAGVAMLHALDIDTAFQRIGLGRHLTRAAAVWAQSQGASHLSLLTTQANVAANALSTSLGMKVVGHYHYRIKNE